MFHGDEVCHDESNPNPITMAMNADSIFCMAVPSAMRGHPPWDHSPSCSVHTTARRNTYHGPFSSGLNPCASFGLKRS